jgi:hypothetical protein
VKGWKVLALVAASIWILTWIYPHCPIEVFVQVALFIGAYLIYKLYKLVDKLLRKKPFKHDIGTHHRPPQTQCIIFQFLKMFLHFLHFFFV